MSNSLWDLTRASLNVWKKFLCQVFGRLKSSQGAAEIHGYIIYSIDIHMYKFPLGLLI